MTTSAGPPARPFPGARGLRRALVPWRRRFAWLFVTWLGVVLATTIVGLAPEALLLLVLLTTVFAVLWFALDHPAANHLTVWPLTDGHLGSGARGNDFRVTSLATRLTAANASREGREALVRDLHSQLCTIIRERLFAKHGLVIEEEPKWSQGVMPPDLWDFLVTLPPPDLYRPERLDGILTRIESW